MANRILIGDHDDLGYGMFVGKSGTDVTAADNDYFLFDSTGSGMQQALFWKEVNLTDAAQTATITFTNYAVRCFAVGTMSWVNGNQHASNVSCKSASTGTVRAQARWSPFGGNIPTTSSTDGETIGFSLNNVNNGDGTGTVTVTRLDEADEGKDICVQVLMFKEPA